MTRNRFLRSLAMLAAVVMVAFLLASALLIAVGMRDDIRAADVAVVLGNTVNPDGTPSRRLAARLDMEKHHWKSVLVITQYFHIPRSRLALSRAGIDPVYSAHARYFELRDIYSIVREVIGCLAYFFMDTVLPQRI